MPILNLNFAPGSPIFDLLPTPLTYLLSYVRSARQDSVSSALPIYTLAVKKNCSLVVQIVIWFAAVGTSLFQSSSGSGSKETVTMFNQHFCLIFRWSH